MGKKIEKRKIPKFLPFSLLDLIFWCTGYSPIDRMEIQKNCVVSVFVNCSKKFPLSL
jgi:hypothetical protein